MKLIMTHIIQKELQRLTHKSFFHLRQIISSFPWSICCECDEIRLSTSSPYSKFCSASFVLQSEKMSGKKQILFNNSMSFGRFSNKCLRLLRKHRRNHSFQQKVVKLVNEKFSCNQLGTDVVYLAYFRLYTCARTLRVILVYPKSTNPLSPSRNYGS